MKKITHLLLSFLFLTLCTFIASSCDDDDDDNGETGPDLAITGIDPLTAKIGDLITITGTGFNATPSQNLVEFNSSVPAQVTEATATVLKVVVPNNAVSGPIKITVGEKSSTSQQQFTLDTTPPDPEITTINPTHGFAGTEVLITGTNFSPAIEDITVLFNTTEAEVLSSSETEIRVTVPQGLPDGEVEVTVDRAGKISSPKSFVVDPLPKSVKTSYWSSLSTINKGTINDEGGATIEVLYDAEDGVGYPTGIEINVNDNKIYWINSFSAQIMRAPLDGTGPIEVLYTYTDDMISFAADIALDAENQHIYITTYTTDSKTVIQKGNLSDRESGIVPLYDVESQNGDLNGIKLAISDGKLYWTEYVSKKVKVGSLDGSLEPQVLFDDADGLVAPYNVAVDTKAGKIFILDTDGAVAPPAPTDAIYSGNLDGTGTLTKIVDAGDDMYAAQDVEIDPDNEYVFWINFRADGDLKRAKYDGSTVETLFTGITDGQYFDLDIR